MPDYLMREFNGGCTTADGCRLQPLLAAILAEANARLQAPPIAEAERTVLAVACKPLLGEDLLAFSDPKQNSFKIISGIFAIS